MFYTSRESTPNLVAFSPQPGRLEERVFNVPLFIQSRNFNFLSLVFKNHHQHTPSLLLLQWLYIMILSSSKKPAPFCSK